ncbi:hypothetical protein C8J56DRAFT_792336 [Mycena floridula]|nr:hypothetical protein C8J56DRAFT_792336 [Mycena floridula]
MAVDPKASIKRPQSGNSLLEAPLSPAAARLPHLQPQSLSRSPSPSPPNLGRKTSLIDLKDWIVDDGSPPQLNGFRPKPVPINGRKRSDPPLINLESPPNSKITGPKAPPLPPRKPSLLSLKAAANGSTTSLPVSTTKPRSVPVARHHSESLTVEHTYPPNKLDLDSPNRNGHVAGSSISSFHSVSLSSDTEPGTPGSSHFIATYPVDLESVATSNGSEGDSISLDESYENVSTTSLASPTTVAMISQDWEKAMAQRKPVPPKLPRRPSAQSPTSPPASSVKSPPGTRRAAPLPPSRASTSSIISSSSTTSPRRQALPKVLLSRPTPVPAAARKRYELVFNANVVQRRKQKPLLLSPVTTRKTRQAAGWRGLSIDLTTNDPSPDDDWVEDGDDLVIGSHERLEGYIVRHIWSRSKLDKAKLGEIWKECDVGNRGTLDCEGFVKGMWRIDEDLRRSHVRSSVSSTSSAASRRPIPVPKPPKFILH